MRLEQFCLVLQYVRYCNLLIVIFLPAAECRFFKNSIFVRGQSEVRNLVKVLAIRTEIFVITWKIMEISWFTDSKGCLQEFFLFNRMSEF